MKVFNCRQGTPEWYLLRAGRPTASEFKRVLTGGEKVSGSQEKYMYELLAEMMLGRPLESPKLPWMERGTNLEDKAADWYSLQRDVDLERVGFITTDDERVGASPDRLVPGGEGIVELKAPSPGVHIQYLLFPKRGVAKEYKVQIQGQLYVTERKWCDIVSYHPILPSVIVRVERDEEFIKKLADELTKFCDDLDLHKADLERLYGPMPGRGEPSKDFFDVTEDDVDQILEQYRQQRAKGETHVS